MGIGSRSTLIAVRFAAAMARIEASLHGAFIMGFSTQTSVGELLDNESTKAVLEQVLPGIANHPQIGMARGMSLAMAAQFSGGLISQDALEKIDAALKALG
jgi:hypothetical protein